MFRKREQTSVKRISRHDGHCIRFRDTSADIRRAYSKLNRINLSRDCVVLFSRTPRTAFRTPGTGGAARPFSTAQKKGAFNYSTDPATARRKPPLPFHRTNGTHSCSEKARRPNETTHHTNELANEVRSCPAVVTVDIPCFRRQPLTTALSSPFDYATGNITRPSFVFEDTPARTLGFCATTIYKKIKRSCTQRK